MAEIFKIPVKGKDMDFHCGTYATEKTLEHLNISYNEFLVALDNRLSSVVRTYIYFSAKDAQRLKTAKGQAIDFPYDTDDVYDWLDEWGGVTEKSGMFLRKMLHGIYGAKIGEIMARVFVDGEDIESIKTDIDEPKQKKSKVQQKK